MTYGQFMIFSDDNLLNTYSYIFIDGQLEFYYNLLFVNHDIRRWTH